MSITKVKKLLNENFFLSLNAFMEESFKFLMKEFWIDRKKVIIKSKYGSNNNL
jgi:hypothetical protein